MIDLRNTDCMILLSEMESKTVDLVLTDPPYGMDFQSNHRKEKHKKITGDDNLDWLPKWIDEIARVTTPVIAGAIRAFREKKIRIIPGGGGKYGTIELPEEEKVLTVSLGPQDHQTSLLEY